MTDLRNKKLALQFMWQEHKRALPFLKLSNEETPMFVGFLFEKSDN